MSEGAVVFRRTGAADDIDGIDEYSRRLVAALGQLGVEAAYQHRGLSAVLAREAGPAWVLLQYNPFRYGRAGFAPDLIRDLAALRRRWPVPVGIMVHEAWIDMRDAKSAAIGAWQRGQLRALLRQAGRVMTSTEALAREIGRGAIHVPVAANILPGSISRAQARAELQLDGRLVVALFGRSHESRALEYAEAAIAALADAHGAERLTVLNLGAGAPTVRVPSGVAVSSPGTLAARELSLRLLASDMALLPLRDGLSTRRGTLMAALAHGIPVLGLRGGGTDSMLVEARTALVLTPTDRAAYARAAVELSAEADRLRRIGQEGRRLYESRFDWPVLARRVAAEIEAMVKGPGAAKARVTFVAGEVGPGGGMELQSAHLVNRLLAAGHPVTVIARSCKLEPRAGLRFVRVPTPRRPAMLAYPAFVAVASLLAALRRGALLHTTGALVIGRADVSTVHYVHRAAAAKLLGSRASRPTLAYRVNSAVAGTLSRAGEAWCYRPGRSRVVCAVSSGVAAELAEWFPDMGESIHTIPNGVDAQLFKPDPLARQAVRRELGLDGEEPLALFVGGDWDRKGLRHAVEALGSAPDWHLAVAGDGDRGGLTVLARQVGAEARLHLLGRVSDTPRVYAAADAFVLPTAYEAFPLVVLEAAASGLPLLVTRVNGVEDLVEPGRNGWFISQDAADIACRLNHLRGDPKLARAMRSRARAAASEYSWDAMADGYRALYSELARGRVP